MTVMSRCSKVAALVGNAGIVILSLGLVVGLTAMIKTPDLGFVVAGVVLGFAAVADMLPWSLSDRIALTAFRTLCHFATSPSGEVARMEETIAHAKAAAHSERSARTIAEFQTRPTPQVEMPVVDAEVQEDGTSEVGDEDAENASLPGQHSSLRTSSDSFSRQGSTRRRRIARYLACFTPVILIVLGCVGAAVGIHLLVGTHPAGEFVGLGIAAVGPIYWLGTLGLLLGVAVCGPPSLEPLRGPDGFYMVRSLLPAERASR